MKEGVKEKSVSESEKMGMTEGAISPTVLYGWLKTKGWLIKHYQRGNSTEKWRQMMLK